MDVYITLSGVSNHRMPTHQLETDRVVQNISRIHQPAAYAENCRENEEEQNRS